MTVYTCGAAVAAKALDDAGHAYDMEVVGGFKRIPLSRRGQRQQIIG